MYIYPIHSPYCTYGSSLWQSIIRLCCYHHMIMLMLSSGLSYIVMPSMTAYQYTTQILLWHNKKKRLDSQPGLWSIVLSMIVSALYDLHSLAHKMTARQELAHRRWWYIISFYTPIFLYCWTYVLECGRCVKQIGESSGIIDCVSNDIYSDLGCGMIM